MSQRGLFITLEGIEGVGKTTNQRFIADLVRKRQLDVLETREPGGTPFAESIRDLVLAPCDDEPAPSTELLLMFAARAQHVAGKIEPALAAGQWVICDRFTDATRAYQGYGRGMSQSSIDALAQIAHPQLTPDLTLLFDLSPELSLARRYQRDYSDRFEVEQQLFFERVRLGYLKLAAANAVRFRIIDASLTLEEVQEQLGSIVTSFLESNDK